MSRIRALVGLSVVLIVGLNCGTTDPPPPDPDPVPTTVTLNKTTVNLDALSATDQLAATVQDQNGNPMSAAVSWSTNAAAIATVSSSGLVTAIANGGATITATAGSATADASVTVAQVATQLQKVEGDGQVGPAGDPLPVQVTVQVSDRLGRPVPGGAGGQVANANVQYAVTVGNGSVDPTLAPIGSDGRASTTWTLGDSAGATEELNASIVGGPSLAIGSPFTATTTAAGADSVETTGGNNQTGAVAAALPDSLSVTVRDSFGNLVPNALVTFAATSGGGSVSPDSVMTDSAGHAASQWTLGGALGTQTAIAAAGSDTTVFTATGEEGPPDSIAVVAGDGQSATVNTAVATNPVVRVVDGGGNPLMGVEVNFAASGSGSVSVTTDTTDGAGDASAGAWTLDTLAGTNTLSVTVPSGPSGNVTATGTPDAANSIAIFQGDNQSAVTGTAVNTPPAVLVSDQFSNPISGESISFVVASGGGSVTGSPATTDSAGVGTVGSWTLGPTTGANTLDATHGVVGTVTFNATGVEAGAGFVEVADGDNQVGLVDFAVNIPPVVLVRGNDSLPFDGATVVFTVASGGGSVTGDTVVTDSTGLAEVGSWVLGSGEGVNTLTATVQDTGVTDNPVTFTATGQLSQFNIEVRFTGGASPTASQQAAFDSAEAFWERALISEHADFALNLPQDACGIPHPAVNETIDDLLIFAAFDSIDGSSGTLAQAGFCVIRNGGDSIPVFGLMVFDTADVGTFAGQLDRIVLHEMGHVLGITRGMWGPKGFLQNPSLPSSPGVDTHYTGPRGLTAFSDLGGDSYTGGNPVPVENSAVGGSADSHWRESVFDDELMSPIIDAGLNPLSILSIAALWDIGYTVNLAAADPYSQAFTSPPGFTASGRVDLRGDVLEGPVYVVDRRGRLVELRRY